MVQIEREHQERTRELAAAGRYDARYLRSIATTALLKSYGMLPVDPQTAWEYAQFAADMLRASLPTEARI